MPDSGLSEDDISVKFITPAIVKAGWDEATQIRRQVAFTKGRISKRREGLDAALSDLLDALFESRILPFDRTAASAYARVFSRARTKGQVISVADAQIAAIATAHGFTVATRDTAPFIAAGVRVINPWNEG